MGYAASLRSGEEKESSHTEDKIFGVGTHVFMFLYFYFNNVFF